MRLFFLVLAAVFGLHSGADTQPLTEAQMKMKSCGEKWLESKEANKVSGKEAYRAFLQDCLRHETASVRSETFPAYGDSSRAGAASDPESERLTQAEIQELRRRLAQCWSPPVGAANADHVQVVLRVLFKPDGSLASQPQLVAAPANSVLAPAMAESARRALLTCQPFTMLRPEHYKQWQDMEITFDPKDMPPVAEMDARPPAKLNTAATTKTATVAWPSPTPPTQLSPSRIIESLNLGSRGRGTMVELAITILVHAVLLSAAVGQLILLMIVIMRFSDVGHEKIMRALAATAGLLVFVGAKAVGLSIPVLVFNALSTTIPISVGLMGIVLPSMTGILVAWFVVNYLNSKYPERNVVGMRVLAMVMTFVFFLYCDSYVAGYGEHGRNDYLSLLPNLSFVLSVLLYAIFKYHPYGKEHSASQSRA